MQKQYGGVNFCLNLCSYIVIGCVVFFCYHKGQYTSVLFKIILKGIDHTLHKSGSWQTIVPNPLHPGQDNATGSNIVSDII